MDGTEGKQAASYLVDAQGYLILALAGLWERWRNSQTRDDILTCTLIVTEPTKWMLPYHDRMPVLLQQQAEIGHRLSGEMEAKELNPASESALRE